MKDSQIPAMGLQALRRMEQRPPLSEQSESCSLKSEGGNLNVILVPAVDIDV